MPYDYKCPTMNMIAMKFIRIQASILSVSVGILVRCRIQVSGINATVGWLHSGLATLADRNELKKLFTETA